MLRGTGCSLAQDLYAMAAKKKVTKKKTTAKKKVIKNKNKKELPKPKELNAKEKIFVQEYLIDLNATQAAIRAGYAATTADKQAPLWIGKNRATCPENKRHIWDAVHKAIEERIERTKIDADYVLKTLADWLEADPCDIIDEDTGGYLPIHNWPKVWRQMLTAADVKEIFEYQGDRGNRSREKIGEIIKYRFIDKVRALELTGKHIDVKAFTESREISGPNGKPIKTDLTYKIEVV